MNDQPATAQPTTTPSAPTTWLAVKGGFAQDGLPKADKKRKLTKEKPDPSLGTNVFGQPRARREAPRYKLLREEVTRILVATRGDIPETKLTVAVKRKLGFGVSAERVRSCRVALGLPGSWRLQKMREAEKLTVEILRKREGKITYREISKEVKGKAGYALGNDTLKQLRTKLGYGKTWSEQDGAHAVRSATSGWHHKAEIAKRFSMARKVRVAEAGRLVTERPAIPPQEEEEGPVVRFIRGLRDHHSVAAVHWELGGELVVKFIDERRFKV